MPDTTTGRHHGGETVVNRFVCADCGHKQDDMGRPCDRCKSIRVVLASVVEEIVGVKHVVAISGGKDSTALALARREREPDTDFLYLITPVGNELPEMAAHWNNLERLLGKPMIRLQPFGAGDGLRHLIEKMKALPNWRQRWCTRMLKIEPAIAWLSQHTPCVQYVGLRADEDVDERTGITGEIPSVTQRFPFREWGWGLDDVLAFLMDRGIRVPIRTDCGWCPFQRIIDWYRLWQEHPDVFEEGVQMEKLTGHTFRSAGRDTWPAALEDLRKEFEGGRHVRGMARPGCVQLNLLEQPDEDQQACRVCRM